MTSRLLACITLGIRALSPAWPVSDVSLSPVVARRTTILVSATLDGDSEIYVLPIDGGPARRLTDNTADDDIAMWTDQVPGFFSVQAGAARWRDSS